MNEEIMKRAGFIKEIELVKKGLCPMCEKPIKTEDFKDEASVQEFKISGICQKCQDEVFDNEK